METAEDGKFEQIFLYNQCNDWTEHYVNYSLLRLHLHASAGLSPTRLDSVFHRVSTKVKAKRSSLARSDLTAPLQSAEEENGEGTPIGSSDWLNDLGSELDRVNVFYTTELQVGARASQCNDGQSMSVDSNPSSARCMQLFTETADKLFEKGDQIIASAEEEAEKRRKSDELKRHALCPGPSHVCAGPSHRHRHCH